MASSDVFLDFKLAWGMAMYVKITLWAHGCYKIIFKPWIGTYMSNQLCEYDFVTNVRS